MNSALPFGAGLGIGLLLALFLFFWLGARVSRQLYNQRLQANEVFNGQLPRVWRSDWPSYTPAFRQTLRPKSAPEWRSPHAIGRINDCALALGYEKVADYGIDESQDLWIRAYLHVSLHAYLLVVDEPGYGLYAEIRQDLQDGTVRVVTSTPDVGIELAPFVALTRVEIDLLTEPSKIRLLQSAFIDVGSSGALQVLPLPCTAANFCSRRERAYAREIEWRIVRGGFTDAELQRIAAFRGDQPLNPEQLQALHAEWRALVPEYMHSEAIERFIGLAVITDGEWERKKDRILVVHNFADVNQLVTKLADLLTETQQGIEQHARSLARVGRCFDGVPTRQAFVAAQAMLPTGSRFELMSSIDLADGVDIYVQLTNLAEAA